MEQAPALQQAPEPQTNDQRIAAFANGFLEDIDNNQDPNQISQEEAAEEQPEVVEEQPEPEAEAQPEIELAEVEYEGKNYQVPPELREALLRQSDYTRKTQEVAASRKNLEAMQQATQQLMVQAEQFAPLNAQLFAMQSQANQLRGQLTQELLNSDPIGYNTTQGQLGLLMQDINGFYGHMQQMKAQYTQQTEALRSKQMEEGLPNLRKAIPDFDKQETKRAILEYAINKGLPQEALQYIAYSPAAVELIYKAQQFEKLSAKQIESSKKLQETVKGLPAVKPSGRPDKGAQTKQLQDQWKKDKGKLDSPAFDALLRQRINRS